MDPHRPSPATSILTSLAPRGLRARPDALLLDFGGVLFRTRKRATGRADFAAQLARSARQAGHDLDERAALRSLSAGLDALKDWKNAAGRRREPRELTPRELWEDFLASDLPDPVRAMLAGDAAEWLQRMNGVLSDHELRPGVRDMLAAAHELGIRVGIVSNAHSGRAHRALLVAHGVDGAIDAHVYSDEVGMRKPHPRMIALAAEALGTAPERCWYVGDTQDRDLVAGRRAGVGAVILTRSQHTDSSPYPVTGSADAVLDSPEGIADLLRISEVVVLSATPRPSAAHPDSAEAVPRALLLDHGGVISRSTKDPAAQRRFALDLAARLRRAGHLLDDAAAIVAIERARFLHREWKTRSSAERADGRVPEITAEHYWVELVGAEMTSGIRAWLRTEAESLSHAFALIKSSVEMRVGVAELFELCAASGIRIAIVSNTLSGRAVRDRLRAHGIDHLVSASVYSDELGWRKPDAAMPLAALRALDVAAADCWFVGDKPDRDMAAAHAVGIRTTVLVRGGSSDEPRVTAALTGEAAERPDIVVDSMRAVHDHLLALLQSAPRDTADRHRAPRTATPRSTVTPERARS